MSAASDDRKSAFDERGAGVEAAGRQDDKTPAQEIPAEEHARRRTAIEGGLALRDSGRIKPATLEEILAWRHEGHRY